MNPLLEFEMGFPTASVYEDRDTEIVLVLTRDHKL
jgi:hypothetical protein